MHAIDVERFRQTHDTTRPHGKSERRTHVVLVLTAIVMVAELVVGTMSHSLALTADGWHMGTHAGAFTVAAFGYWFARTRAKDARFSFGTGKVYALSGFASAIGLGAITITITTITITIITITITAITTSAASTSTSWPIRRRAYWRSSRSRSARGSAPPGSIR